MPAVEHPGFCRGAQPMGSISTLCPLSKGVYTVWVHDASTLVCYASTITFSLNPNTDPATPRCLHYCPIEHVCAPSHERIPLPAPSKTPGPMRSEPPRSKANNLSLTCHQQQQPGSPWHVHGKISHIGARASSGADAARVARAAMATRMVVNRMVFRR
jgi:hypothetical protein